jgi:hypothetical protein
MHPRAMTTAAVRMSSLSHHRAGNPWCAERNV